MMQMPLRVLQIWEKVEGQMVPTRYRLQMWVPTGWEDVPIVHKFPNDLVEDLPGGKEIAEYEGLAMESYREGSVAK